MTDTTSAGGATLPRYEAPRRLVARFALDLILGRRQSFARDAQTVLRANPAPRRIDGVEHVPERGTFIVVMNHYSRRGLRPYHCAMVVSAALAERRPDQPEICWAFASEMYGQRIGPLPIPLWLVRLVFRRVGLVYGLVVIPRREELVMARAAALRRLVKALRTRPAGLTPEGVGTGELVEPPRGSGLMLAALGREAPFVPVATWEEADGTLVVRFGGPFYFTAPADLPRAGQDDFARTQVMLAIGRLMPPERQGAYRSTIAGSAIDRAD